MRLQSRSIRPDCRRTSSTESTLNGPRRCRSGGYQVRLVGLEPMQRELSFFRINGKRPQAELGCGSKNSDSNFGSIHYEKFFDSGSQKHCEESAHCHTKRKPAECTAFRQLLSWDSLGGTAISRLNPQTRLSSWRFAFRQALQPRSFSAVGIRTGPPTSCSGATGVRRATDRVLSRAAGADRFTAWPTLGLRELGRPR